MTATIERIKRPESWRRFFVAQNGVRCHYCNRAGSMDMGPGNRPWHIDHMNPLACGGEDVEENLALSCKRCNLAKSTQPYDAFKAFAFAAWWQDRDGVDEGELDALAELWRLTAAPGRGSHANGKWWLDRDEEGHLLIVDADEGGPGSDAASPVLQTAYRSDRAGDNAVQFALKAHSLVPDLIAEIRQLKAELREKEAAA